MKKTFIQGKLLRTIKSTNKHVYMPPKYPIKEWNVYERFNLDLDRTTNMQEAYNRKLQSCNYSGSHPTLYTLTTLLLNFNQQMLNLMKKHITAGIPTKK